MFCIVRDARDSAGSRRQLKELGDILEDVFIFCRELFETIRTAQSSIG